MKSATVALIGRPSSGKSSLVNLLSGHKVSIVTPVPQTTRNTIRGIYSEARGQLVFLDTPGFFNSEKKFNLHLQAVMREATLETDLILYVIDLSRPPGEEEKALADMVRPYAERTVVAYNKVDLPTRAVEACEGLVAEISNSLPSVRVSARTGSGLEELVQRLFERAPEGPLLYPTDYYTDQEPGFRIAEMIRERVILHTREELPHAVYIEIADLEMHDEGNELWARGFICVERESQKGIVIGRGGEKIRAIMREATAELEALFPYRLSLDFRVKVRPGWRNNSHLLEKLIH